MQMKCTNKYIQVRYTFQIWAIKTYEELFVMYKIYLRIVKVHPVGNQPRFLICQTPHRHIIIKTLSDINQL